MRVFRHQLKLLRWPTVYHRFYTFSLKEVAELKRFHLQDTFNGFNSTAVQSSFRTFRPNVFTDRMTHANGGGNSSIRLVLVWKIF